MLKALSIGSQMNTSASPSKLEERVLSLEFGFKFETYILLSRFSHMIPNRLPCCPSPHCLPRLFMKTSCYYPLPEELHEKTAYSSLYRSASARYCFTRLSQFIGSKCVDARPSAPAFQMVPAESAHTNTNMFPSTAHTITSHAFSTTNEMHKGS